MSSPAARPRITPGTAAAALAAIAVAGVAIVGFSLTRADDGSSTVVAGHGHGAGQSGAEATATPEQQERAAALIDGTKAAIARYADVSVAEAAGYHWIGDGAEAGRYRHYVQPLFLLDPDVLDPHEAESLVYRTEGDGSLTLVSAMYILPPGSTLADAPDVAGELAPWHDHTDLCWARDGTLSSTTDTGTCPDGSTARATPPMLHVWIVDNPNGPFAGIDAHGGTVD
ncbi:MAG: hypothetical protein JWP85_610 [Rhodoglobus sp.]|nr:hypothetical protein [Rhodoglobus sp.]